MLPLLVRLHKQLLCPWCKYILATTASQILSPADRHDPWPPYECEAKCSKAFIASNITYASTYGGERTATWVVTILSL